MYDIRTDRDHDNDHFYPCLVIFTGVMIGKRKKSVEGFYLGGRGMGPGHGHERGSQRYEQPFAYGYPSASPISAAWRTPADRHRPCHRHLLNLLLVARRLRRYSVS